MYHCPRSSAFLSKKQPRSSKSHHTPQRPRVYIFRGLGLLLLLLVPVFVGVSLSYSPSVVVASQVFRRFGGIVGGLTGLGRASSELSPTATTMSSTEKLTPVYFISHGGPNVMFQTDHPAFGKLQTIGREITQKIKPKAVVVFSAHWQVGRNSVEVNTAEFTDLIYDYYGFPDYYYKVKYPSVGSKELGEKVLELLQDANIEAEAVKRGLDHGVFAPFTCMFHPEENPLKVPLVQVSLFKNEDPNKHYELGQAVAKLRSEGIVVICSGMAVHNLRDLRFAMMSNKPLEYAETFDAALKESVVNVISGDDRKKKLAEIIKRSDARKAHPTFEHLLPVHIAAGAAGDDKATQLWTLPEGSMSWAQYRFGEIQA